MKRRDMQQEEGGEKLTIRHSMTDDLDTMLTRERSHHGVGIGIHVVMVVHAWERSRVRVVVHVVVVILVVVLLTSILVVVLLLTLSIIINLKSQRGQIFQVVVPQVHARLVVVRHHVRHGRGRRR